ETVLNQVGRVRTSEERSRAQLGDRRLVRGYPDETFLLNILMLTIPEDQRDAVMKTLLKKDPQHLGEPVIASSVKSIPAWNVLEPRFDAPLGPDGSPARPGEESIEFVFYYWTDGGSDWLGGADAFQEELDFLTVFARRALSREASG
ncbi:MAG TPA: hypothetical protein VM492_02215, partial [Sumerlaeia bacterium]|nr:hypothetical protein [Sumerlaeia bacterium]